MLRSFTAAVIAALVGSSPAIAAPAQRPGAVALLPLAPASPGLPYAPLPSPVELRDLTGRLRAGFTEGGVRVVPLPRVSLAVTSEGFAQDSLQRPSAQAQSPQT